ncbi:MAG: cation:proton antiporter [Polyangiales bacterium]
MIRALLLLFVVVTLMANARAFVGNAEPPFGSGVSLAFGFLVLAAYMAGEAIASLRLPKLTGYLFLGLACGPSATNLVTSSMIERLSLVNGVAVGLIALTAGGEINLVELRPRLRLLSRLTAFSVIAGIVVCTVSVMALSSWLTFLSEYTLAQRVSIALLLGVVLASLSPAVVLALLSEQRAAGALSSSMLGAVVLGEVAIVLCFALAHSLAAAMFGGHTSEISPGLALAIELGGSAVVGVIAGAILALYVRRVNKQIALFVVALCLVVAEVGARLHLDVVIVCLTAGLCLENFFGVRGHVLARELEPATVPIFAVFFSVAGARLDLSLLAALMPIALTIAAVRALSFVAASYAATRVAGVEPTVRRWVVAGLLPQGGVSVGLAGMIASHFSGWGRGAASLALAVIAINQVIGPIITRLAVVSTGEAGQRADDAHADAPSEHAALEDEPR